MGATKQTTLSQSEIDALYATIDEDQEDSLPGSPDIGELPNLDGLPRRDGSKDRGRIDTALIENFNTLYKDKVLRNNYVNHNQGKMINLYKQRPDINDDIYCGCSNQLFNKISIHSSNGVEPALYCPKCQRTLRVEPLYK